MAGDSVQVERPTIEGLNNPPHFANAVVSEGGKMVHLSGQLGTEGGLVPGHRELAAGALLEIDVAAAIDR